MGGGAAQLLPFHVYVREEVLNGVRPWRRKPDERCCNFSARSSNLSLPLSAAASRLHFRSVRHVPADAQPTFGRRNLLVGGNRQAQRSARQCSESGVAESAAPESDTSAAYDSSGNPREVVGASYSSNGPAILYPGRPNGDSRGEPGMEAGVLTEDSKDELDVFSAAAALDKMEAKLQLLRKDQDSDRGTVKDESQGQQAKAPPLVSGEESKSMLEQMRDIFVFAGPALGIWLSGPLMSIIDTAVIGNSSSLELAALGPGTVLCDQTSFVFMFLSIATSNLIATSLAHKDEAEAAGHLSRLLFVALFCGIKMLLITVFFATPMLQAFVGPKNYSLLPAARLYVQIRALAWPVVLVGMVSQSASLGMQDSWAPLKSLAVASSVNLVGDILLCSVLGYGIGGAAWATMVSQYVAAFLMLKSLGDKGYNPLAISVPSMDELINMVNLTGPILLTMLSKACFYTVITFLATSLGSITLAAHQVMVGIFSVCTVCGEPLAQTAQSFMPAFIYGSNKNLKQARSLLRNLMLIGTIVGFILGATALSIPWFFPQIFTRDAGIITQMRSVSVPFFLALVLTPPTLSCEGTLLAGRDLKYLGFSMLSCFCGGTVLLLTLNRLGVGLAGSWWTLVAFQLIRFIRSYTRLSGSESVLADRSTSSTRGEEEHSVQLT